MQALNVFWAFSLKRPGEGWKALPPWPGPARILPAAAGRAGEFYLLGGAELTGTAGPPPGRRFLKDAYRYRPGKGWERLPDLPIASSAGYAVMDGKDVVLLGGNDGEFADREFEMKDNHPGFPLNGFRLSPASGVWQPAGKLPTSLVTSGLALWEGEIVIAGGEDRPGHRSRARHRWTLRALRGVPCTTKSANCSI